MDTSSKGGQFGLRRTPANQITRIVRRHNPNRPPLLLIPNRSRVHHDAMLTKTTENQFLEKINQSPLRPCFPKTEID